MARRRPDVTMAGPGMPVRPFSVGGLVAFLTLAAPAMRGVAATKAPPAETDEDNADAPKVVVVPTEGAKAVAAPAPPRQVADAEAGGVPAPIDTVGFSDRLFVRSPGGEVVVFPGGRVQVDA